MRHPEGDDAGLVAWHPDVALDDLVNQIVKQLGGLAGFIVVELLSESGVLLIAVLAVSLRSGYQRLAVRATACGLLLADGLGSQQLGAISRAVGTPRVGLW